MDNYTTLPTTAEEEEAMNAITQARADAFQQKSQYSAEVLHNNQTQLDPQRIIDEMVAQFSIKLSLLLTTVIMNQTKAQPNPTPPEGDQSLQACVDAVLEQAEWFKEKVEEKVERLVDDMDHTYAIESAVETHFSNSFSLDDHVDITAEVESRVEDIAEDLLRDIVNEKLQEMLSTATITFNN
jgi:ribosome-associated translation inhibitor RaiA